MGAQGPLVQAAPHALKRWSHILIAPLLLALAAACDSASPAPGDEQSFDAQGPRRDSVQRASSNDPDAGAGVHADSDADRPLEPEDAAWPQDTGSTDLGVPPPDSGAADSGASDSAASDSGAADAGRPRRDSGIASPDGGVARRDSGTSPSDSGSAGPPDSGASSGDGPPMRMPCASSLGSSLSTEFGRMDGYLVAIVPPGGPRACHGDRTHVHLQVMIQGSVFDVAVNTDTQQFENDLSLSMPWSEGWHPGVSLDYAQLGLHSGSFADPMPDAPAAIDAFLQTANHITVYATGYSASGLHDVHRRSGGDDGAIIINPLSLHPRGLFFRFTRQSF
jgi:hypothetical protein